jgi:hypothetical protein
MERSVPIGRQASAIITEVAVRRNGWHGLHTDRSHAIPCRWHAPTAY